MASLKNKSLNSYLYRIETSNQINTSIVPDKILVEYYRKRNRIHPDKFKIIMQPWNLCTQNNGSNLELFIYVHTRMTSVSIRNIMRRTWTNRTLFPTVNVAFVVGSSLNSTLNQLNIEENKLHGDMIQGDFIDTYLNVSFKELAGMRWIKDNCMNAKYILKLDDDVVVNMPLFIKRVRSGFFKMKLRTLLCQVLYKQFFSRDPKSIFYISYEEYNLTETYFEPYCAGHQFILSPDLIPLMYNLSFVNIDSQTSDVYMGILANRVPGLNMIDHKEWECDIRRMKKTLIVRHNLKSCMFIASISKISDFQKVSDFYYKIFYKKSVYFKGLIG